jgi:hypothetical protein
MAALDKPLAYIQNMLQGDGAEASADSSALVRVRVEVAGFPPSIKNLGPGNYTLGASPDCELIIPEAPADEVALLHVRAGSEPSELVALSRGITINGRAFNLQQREPLNVETSLKIGGTRITLTPKISNFQRAGNMLRSVKAPVSFTAPVALLFVALVLGLTAWFSSGPVPPPANYTYSISQRTLPVSTVSPTAKLDTPTEAANELNRLFRAADLANQVNASADISGVLVSGAVDNRAEQRMNEILQLVGSRTRVTIRSNVRPDTSTLVDAISGVALAPARYIVLRDGERYRTGDLMPNGWMVESIDERQVVVVRDGLREILDLAE